MSKPENYPNEPKHIWERFYQITRVPRPSKKEQKFIDYLSSEAKKKGLEYKIDAIGNVVIYLPGSKGYENKEGVIIQNHMDMVCDKLPDREINFDEDPIDLMIEDGYVTAVGTTLGADNGIGCAAALAFIDDDSLEHPPLELLFTVDEETGLGGALNLDPALISGTRMINMDTEEWGAFYIGCAGGEDYQMHGEFCQTQEATKENGFLSLRVDVKGLKGGHSGIDIHEDRGNAIKILVDLLKDLASNHSFFLAEFGGGQAHNIIPRDSYAIITVKSDVADKIETILQNHLSEMKGHFKKPDLDVSILVSSEECRASNLTIEERDRFLDLLVLAPHGAFSYNWESEEPLVNISSNLAIVKMINGEFYLEMSSRFFVKNHVKEIRQKMKVLSSNFNVRLEIGSGYPSWEPEFEGNNLLELSKNIYKELFRDDAKVKAIHAGLECGVLKDKLGKMDIISLGPNLQAVHSPSERLEIASTNSFWKLLVAILKEL